MAVLFAVMCVGWDVRLARTSTVHGHKSTVCLYMHNVYLLRHPPLTLSESGLTVIVKSITTKIARKDTPGRGIAIKRTQMLWINSITLSLCYIFSGYTKQNNWNYLITRPP